MPEYHGQHVERDWGLWNLPQYLSVPPQDIGMWGIPFAKRCDIVPEKLIPFNIAVSDCRKGKNLDCGVHFFINDYRFERVWTCPEKYIDILSRFSGGIIAPDFSVYTDMPPAMQIWQHFRSRMFSYMCYQAGIPVIPNLIFSGSNTYSSRNGWVFNGIESGGTVCLSNSGCRKIKDHRIALQRGFNSFLEQCTPKTVIIYGDVPDVDWGNIQVYRFKPFGFGGDYISVRETVNGED